MTPTLSARTDQQPAPRAASSGTQRTVFAENAIENLGEELSRLGARRILLVADDPAYRLSGASERLAGVLGDYHVDRFSGFTPNPNAEELSAGVDLCRAASPDVCLAVGGGTAIDLAKLIGLFSAESRPLREQIAGPWRGAGSRLPLIAVPTTAGTGSEATHFAVLYVDGEKRSVAHPSLKPDVALIDPTLTQSLGALATASTGLDALCQGIESAWSVRATGESLELALQAAAEAVRALPRVVHQPSPQTRRTMCSAANLAGRAIDITTTTAAHAVSYALTSDYGVPHGAAVATTIADFLRYNAGVSTGDCADPRGPAEVRQRVDRVVHVLGGATVEDACSKLQSLISSLGCPTSLPEAGVKTKRDAVALLSKVNPTRLANNPRRLDGDRLLGLLYR